MSSRRPRTVLTAAILLLAAVLALFAVALVNSHADDRRDAEQRFAERARISAGLTESLFASVAGQSAAENARRLGGAEVDRGRLERQVREARIAYAAVLDSRGRVLAASRRLPAEGRRRLESRPAPIRSVLGGRPFSLSDFVDVRGSGGVLEFAAPFPTRHGRRVVVQGFPARLLSSFLGGYLARIPEARRASAYVLDAGGRVVGSPTQQPQDGAGGGRVREPGLVAALRSGSEGRFDADGTERAFTSAPVQGSDWRVVLSTPSSVLYAGTNPLVQWLVLLALAGAGAAAVFLLSRTVRSAAEIEAANASLEHTNAELARSNLELKRSNAELEQFASVASHDLQEPLRKVQSFGDQLERRFAADLPPEAVDYLRRMRSSANRMSTLIEDLLRFSRVSTREQLREQVDLDEVTREVVAADLDGMVQETHGTVHIGELPTVLADPLQMRQLVQNLIANALKFHRPGVAPEVRVEPVPTDAPGLVGFAVTDNGIGFEAQYTERIFRVFERLHPHNVYTGTGIGLALCRKIVERHGGTITAESVEGQGARFTVALPAAPGRSRAATPRHDEPRVAAHV